MVTKQTGNQQRFPKTPNHGNYMFWEVADSIANCVCSVASMTLDFEINDIQTIVTSWMQDHEDNTLQESILPNFKDDIPPHSPFWWKYPISGSVFGNQIFFHFPKKRPPFGGLMRISSFPHLGVLVQLPLPLPATLCSARVLGHSRACGKKADDFDTLKCSHFFPGVGYIQKTSTVLPYIVAN